MQACDNVRIALIRVCSSNARLRKPRSLLDFRQVLEERPVSLFFSESPTNPYLRCVDVPRIAELCHAKGALVVIDSTFATPVNQRVSLGFGRRA